MSTQDIDPFKVSSPRIFLFRMVVFLALVGVVVTLLHRQIQVAFMANPGLNGVIVAVALIGIILTFRQVIRLFPEARWINNFRVADPGVTIDKAPTLLAPMAALLGGRTGRVSISTLTMRSLLDSLASRLDEGHELSRYLTGLLVFLGLLGTFWGLIETVTSVSKVINALSAGGELGAVFEEMKKGLAEPLGGMGIAFSSSLFGLACSLVLGFLDLQASQGQNRFYTEVEDWLATTARDHAAERDGLHPAYPLAAPEDLHFAFERLRDAVIESGTSAKATVAMANLAEGIQGLVTHLRTEHELLRQLVDEQKQHRGDLQALVAALKADREPG